MDLHTRVQPRDGRLCRCHFRLPNRLGGVKDLALQVGQVDRVVIDDGERPDARSRKVGQGCRAQAARADDKRMCFQQTRLPFDADLVEQDMAGVAQQLIVVHGSAMKKAVQCTAS